MPDKFKTQVNSEIGELKGVILHTPGPEIENMNPENAERALYSDILNLAVASKEYVQLKEVLAKTAKTFEVEDLLKNILYNEKVKEDLVKKICINESAECIVNDLMDMKPEDLSKSLLRGVPMKKNNLTKFLSKESYTLKPLHNFFFTRDASMAVRNRVLIGRMKSNIRERESLIMEAIFDYNSFFSTKTVNPVNNPVFSGSATIEGGDVLVARKDILCIGIGDRTNSHGVDFIIEQLKSRKEKRHLIIQELPKTPESFIHLDMVFTFLDKDACMVYKPLILRPNRFQTVHIEIDNGKVVSIKEKENLLSVLKELGMDLKPVLCGGDNDVRIQEREQWHSGANFFAIAPGKVIGYGRNVYTIEEMAKNGFEVIKAKDIIKNKTDIKKAKKCVITIDGSELSRGGGGCRCMTMPIVRTDVK